MEDELTESEVSAPEPVGKEQHKPSLEEAYEFEMDQRMIDAFDPTSFGTDTVYAVGEDDASA